MWSAVALLVAIALLVVLVLQNTQDVEFSFLWFDATLPLILLLLLAAGLAVLIAELIGVTWRHRRRRRLRQRDELRRLRERSR